MTNAHWLIDASDNGRLFQGIFAVKKNGFATVTKLLHGLVPMKQPHAIAISGLAREIAHCEWAMPELATSLPQRDGTFVAKVVYGIGSAQLRSAGDDAAIRRCTG